MRSARLTPRLEIDAVVHEHDERIVAREFLRVDDANRSVSLTDETWRWRCGRHNPSDAAVRHVLRPCRDSRASTESEIGESADDADRQSHPCVRQWQVARYAQQAVERVLTKAGQRERERCRAVQQR